MQRPGFNSRVGKISWQPTPVFLPGECPWTEESMCIDYQASFLQRVRQDWATKHREELASTILNTLCWKLFSHLSYFSKTLWFFKNRNHVLIHLPTSGDQVLPNTHFFCENESRSVMPNSLPSHGLYSSWNSPGQNTGVGSCSFLQGIFPTQGLNPGLPHYRQILYQLSHFMWHKILSFKQNFLNIINSCDYN